ncbi:hypothetical protein MATL_G00254460 [Megalops atlanticus]|uniref:Junctional protein associated with coronary artery disease n=1 Tax=Megalops atlanticus TaxID=7932 RepID=A0A9D3SZU9_MEGAT|nr:hypothetical protein MATL_G00254460 [Megalops atlanticus]
MYSVEDLLISHGYKLPKNNEAPSSCQARYGDCHREMAEDRSGHGTANGREADAGAYVCSRQPAAAAAKGYPGDGERRERNQRRAGAGSGNQGDTQPSGDFLSADSGFYNGTREPYSQQKGEKDVSYWRRRGQDFSLLLDDAEGREPRGGGFGKGEGPRRVQGPPTEERRAERQRWDESAWLRVRDVAQEQWRAAGDRKCQSLGTEEWRPAVGLGRHLSDGEGERWTQEQGRLRATEGAVHPKTKGKSQSLPRVLSPESLQYVDVPASRPDGLGGQRVNGSASQLPHGKFHHSNIAGSREPWLENGRPGLHVALLPKPRFSRPLKPPSYEAHQQIRGSFEMLAGDQVPKSKDRAACPSMSAGPDFFAHELTGSGMEPPVYIPPPSYKRPLLHRGGQKSSDEASSYKFKTDAEQLPWSVEAGKWYPRQTESSWLERQRDRSAPWRKQVFPGRSEDRFGSVQYLPFDDPRVRHISGGPCGNSLTDSDKIRNINKEVPSAKVLGQSTHDSAFLPPQELILNTDTSKMSLSEQDSGNRWHSGLHKGSENSVVSDKTSGEYPTAFQVRSTRQNRNPDQGFSETITQVKKIEPGTEVEKSKNVKKKLNETIFCLVSVPIQLQSNGESSNQVNHEKPPGEDPAESSTENKAGYLQNQSLLSTSSTDLELQALTGGMTNSKGPKNPLARKEAADVRSLGPKKELYSGSWPGDQYRDQETQTSSPEASRGAPQGPTDQQAQDHARSASDTTTDSGVGTDCSNRYGYPMKGQKNLNPSSNSAFSRTATFSSQLHKSTAQSPQPSGNQEEMDYLSAQSGKSKPPTSYGQEAFGQFLLKPVSRRPWDAIEELESFNKELQQQIGKRASVDQCIEDLDEAYKDILELGTVSNNIENAQILDLQEAGATLSDDLLCRTIKVRHAFESWTPAADPAYREVKSAFSRPAGKAASFPKQLREEEMALSESGFREYSVMSSVISEKPAGDCRATNPDIFVPKESQHQDGGLPKQTPAEVPWAMRQPMQDASTLTSPPDYEDLYQALQQSRETANRGVTAKFGSASVAPPQSSFKIVGFGEGSKKEGSSKGETLRPAKKENSVPRFRGEKSVNVVMVKSQSDRFHSRGVPRCIVRDIPTREKDTNGAEAASDDDSDDHFDWRKQLLSAEKHLEALLINEKANSSLAEDLSNLYEVKCAKGIPENESLEERAARILGIDVPAESLGVVEQKVGRNVAGKKEVSESESFVTGGAPKSSANERILHVSRQCEELHVDSSVSEGQEGQETEKVTEPRGDSSLCGAPERISMANHLGFTEFPAERLKLSVAFNTNGTLDLAAGGGDRRGRGPSRAIEALQDKLATPPCRAVVERLVRMKEVDSVSRMRRLSTRSSDSGEEGEDGGAQGPPVEPEGPPPAQREPRNSTVTKREITLPLGFCVPSNRTLPQDEEAVSLSDHYDPSRVERV